MKKVILVLICLCLFLAMSCSNADSTPGDGSTDKYRCTIVMHDGTVFTDVTGLSYGSSAVVHGYLPDGTKIWASGNWYVIREKQ